MVILLKYTQPYPHMNFQNQSDILIAYTIRSIFFDIVINRTSDRFNYNPCFSTPLLNTILLEVNFW